MFVTTPDDATVWFDVKCKQYHTGNWKSADALGVLGRLGVKKSKFKKQGKQGKVGQ